MITRIHKNKLNFMKHLLSSENSLIKHIANKQLESNRSKWAKESNKILKTYDMNIASLNVLSKQQIKVKLQNEDYSEWESNLGSKTSLLLYRKFKSGIQEETFYSNTPESNLLFRCRTNTLNLNDRKRFTNEDTKCPCCTNDYEDLYHFLLHCPKYSDARRKLDILSQPYIEDKDQILNHLLLFENKNHETRQKIMNYIKKIHHIRRKILENINWNLKIT